MTPPAPDASRAGDPRIEEPPHLPGGESTRRRRRRRWAPRPQDSGCKVRLASLRPASGLTEETRRLSAANLFAAGAPAPLQPHPHLQRRAQGPAQRSGRRGRDPAVRDRQVAHVRR